MDPCHDLDETTHLVFQTACEKRNDNQGWSNRMPTTIAEILGMKRNSVQELLKGDLTRAGLVRVRDDGVILLLEVCSCQPSHTERIESAISRTGGRPPGGTLGSPSPSVSLPQGRETTGSGSHHRGDLGGEEISRPSRGAPRKRPEDMNAADLAQFFKLKMDEIREDRSLREVWGTIGASNVSALTGRFAQWRREGLSSAMIYSMIEIFAMDPRWQRQGQVSWKIFLANRATLAERAARRGSHREAGSGWVESPTPPSRRDWDGGWT